MGGRSGVQNLLGDVFDHHSVAYQYASGTRLYAICRTTLNSFNENSSTYLGTKGTAYPMAGRITGQNAWNFGKKCDSPYVLEHRAMIDSIRYEVSGMLLIAAASVGAAHSVLTIFGPGFASNFHSPSTPSSGFGSTAPARWAISSALSARP